MGYYTYYSIDIEGMTPEVKPAVIEAFKDKRIIGYVFDEYLDPLDAVKWYEHDKDMLEISKLFPNLIFHLGGVGDENTDLWETHYKAGKMQHCQAEIVYPPFDEKELR